ncbi:MAG: prephenate dehydrogenase [Clostridium fessum]
MNTPINHLTAGFIGLGLIGGSIARGLKRSAPDIQIMAYMRTREKLEQAHADGIVDLILDGVDEHLSECDIIFLCTPVEFNESYLRQIRPFLKEGAVVTDVGSTKTSIHETVAALGMESCFVGGHPMAGSEKTGYESSTDHLLENAYYIITSDNRTPWLPTLTVCGECGKGDRCAALVLDYHRHDFIVAAISHLPHLIASSLSQPGTRLRQ